MDISTTKILLLEKLYEAILSHLLRKSNGLETKNQAM
nr:MAG TPA: hypothetical protein [Caudoviricetes sp.]